MRCKEVLPVFGQRGRVHRSVFHHGWEGVFVNGIPDSETEYINTVGDGFVDMKKQIMKNEGKFVTLYCAEWYFQDTQGFWNPLDFIDWVEKQNFSFESMSGIRHLEGDSLEVRGFHGNLREANAAFKFRI